MKNLISVPVIFCSLLCVGQNEVDALRYSQNTFGGTARFVSMGGAFGALGGDVSALSFNPAAIGIYRKTELTFSPSVFTQKTTSTYNGSTVSDSKTNFNFGNGGIVLSTGSRNNQSDENKGWMNVNFGFGYNRTNNFNNRTSISGINQNSSMLDTYVGSANGLSPSSLDQFSNYLAWMTYLIDTIPGDPTHYKSAIPAGTALQQKKSIETSGSSGETFITVGGNYGNKLYLGATVGFPHITYNETSSYDETDYRDSVKSSFKSYNYTSSVSTKGSGFNLKMGMIYRATDWFRFGLAVHTPSSFTMSDNYSSKITFIHDNGESTSSSSPSGSFNYRLTTPMKVIGSLGFVIAKKGIVGIDYEMVDYSSATLSSTPNVFSDQNTTIRKNYKTANNLRAGIEWRVDPFSIRAGYAYYGSPYQTGINTDASRMSYSAGFGIKEDGYFIDFAYVLTQYSENYYLYDPSLVSPAKNTMRSSSFMVTLGFRY